MTAALHYWLSTAGPDGAPHTRPVDGMWLDGRLYFGGDSASRWRRNLASDPRVCVNLEDADQAVIMHGAVEETTPDRALAVRLSEASNSKYEFKQTADDYETMLLVFRPRVVLAWNLLYKDATRWDVG
jgi:general stress protein 26